MAHLYSIAGKSCGNRLYIYNRIARHFNSYLLGDFLARLLFFFFVLVPLRPNITTVVTYSVGNWSHNKLCCPVLNLGNLNRLCRLRKWSWTKVLRHFLMAALILQTINSLLYNLQLPSKGCRMQLWQRNLISLHSLCIQDALFKIALCSDYYNSHGHD